MSRLVVSISHVEFTETDQTFYVVKVTQDADEWQVRRSYTDFRRLRDDVARVLKDDKHQLVGDDASRVFARAFHELAFPAKRLFGSKRDHVVKERAVELHHFLIKLLFLTHTYRKAQKQRYDARANADATASADGHAHLAQHAASLVARPHGSASVFYLLRDFLKPSLARPDGARTRASGRHACTDNEDDGDDHARRLLRESKMLAMRASQQPNAPLKTISSPHLLGNGGDSRSRNVSTPRSASTPRSISTPRNASTPRRAAPPPPPPQPIAPDVVAVAIRHGASPPSASDLTHNRSTTQHSNTKTVDIAALKSKPRGASSASAKDVSPTDTATVRKAPASKRFNDRISSNDHQPVLRAIGSDLLIVESTPDPQPRSLSSASTASSTASFNARSLETATALGAAAGASLSSSMNEGPSSRRRPRSKKKTLSASTSSLSRAEKDMRNSLRLSRLTPQLTAQTITVDAQKELEKHVSEYNAIMIMRYVDRFISKAVGKTPGCYTVLDNKLVIDSARFVSELEEVFHDLPSDFQDVFRNSSGEWIIPKALNAYVQLKWDSFQNKLCAPSSGSGTHAAKSRSKGSDSEDSDSDSDYETTGGFMKRKDRTFTDEVSDELQQMIADGTAGKEQMLRLRRQNDEKGWQRRTMPGAKFDNGSDTDDDDNGSGNESIKRFQQQQNAMRKSRMSRHDDMGGLV